MRVGCRVGSAPHTLAADVHRPFPLMSATPVSEPLRTVGIGTLGYPEIRNIAGLPFTRYRVRKFQNLHKVPAWLHDKFKGSVDVRHWNSFRDLDLSPCSLYHFFNVISFGRKPWLSTFETVLPRWGHATALQERKGLELLADDPCKKLIALSTCTAELQKEYVARVAPDLLDRIAAKIVVVHPAQAMGIERLDDKPSIERGVTFTFIGSDFFRKGGREMLIAFDAMVAAGLSHWKLNVVSAMLGDYVVPASAADIAAMHELMAKYPGQIVHHGRSTNGAVLDLLRASHVALLPTWADTYGYSVLEAQACGVPVITTDIRALPEINTERSGWLLRMPLDDQRNGRWRTAEDRVRFARSLRDQLEDRLRGILEDPSVIAPKAKASLDRIRTEHGPASRAAIIEGYYDEALAR